VTRTFPLGHLSRGDGVFASVYFNRAAGSVRFFLSVPDGTGYHYKAGVGGAAGYSRAQALADWAAASPTVPAIASGTREARFLSGGFTTASGQLGTFEGPWVLSPWEATRNGRDQPRGRLFAAPGYLRADGTQRVIGASGDVFGVWLYP
jgi:hypothetical protein